MTHPLQLAERCGLQTIAGIAVALKQAADPAFKEYAKQVIKNSAALAAQLMKYDYKLQTGGSENHLALWDLRPLGLTGSKIEKVCDLCHITLNKVGLQPRVRCTCADCLPLR
jgi:glycine hydroxymethyltransferase